MDNRITYKIKEIELWRAVYNQNWSMQVFFFKKKRV